MKSNVKLHKTSTETTGKIVLYNRISVEKVNHADVSLDAQRDLGLRYANFNRLEVIGVFSETVSGKATHNRPEFNKAVELAVKNGAHLWVYSLSRLARNLRSVLEYVELFQDKNVKLVSHSENLSFDSAAGVLQTSLLGAFYQFEVSLASERTKTALDSLRGSGKRFSGRLPYGYRLASDNKTLVPVKAEQKVVLLINNLREEGFSYPKIAAELNRKGIATQNGGEWIHQTVRAIYKRHTERFIYH